MNPNVDLSFDALLKDRVLEGNPSTHSLWQQRKKQMTLVARDIHGVQFTEELEMTGSFFMNVLRNEWEIKR